MDEWMDGWMDGWMCGWMDQSIDTWADENVMNGWIDTSLSRYLHVDRGRWAGKEKRTGKKSQFGHGKALEQYHDDISQLTVTMCDYISPVCLGDR